MPLLIVLSKWVWLGTGAGTKKSELSHLVSTDPSLIKSSACPVLLLFQGL